MPAPILVDGLINQVRDQTDEFSEANLTDADILQALNRGQSHGVSIMARHYEDPFIYPATLTLLSGTSTYSIPEDVFEDRIQRVEILVGDVVYPVKRIPYRDIHKYESSASVPIPTVYTIYGRTMRFLGTPSGTYDARIWCMREPETLVESQGRIIEIDVGTGELTLDAVGSDMTTSLAALKCFFNVIDAQTGEIKGTYQTSNISDAVITIKDATPSRTTIYNDTVETTLGSTISQDDYICLAGGTCVPFMKHPLSNFLVQFAVAEIRRRLEDNGEMEARVLKEFEREVERQWAGRELQQRVSRRSNKWLNKRFNRHFLRG